MLYMKYGERGGAMRGKKVGKVWGGEGKYVN